MKIRTLSTWGNTAENRSDWIDSITGHFLFIEYRRSPVRCSTLFFPWRMPVVLQIHLQSRRAWFRKIFQPTDLTSKETKMNTITKAVILFVALTLPAISGVAYSHQQSDNSDGMMMDLKMMSQQAEQMRERMQQNHLLMEKS